MMLILLQLFVLVSGIAGTIVHLEEQFDVEL